MYTDSYISTIGPPFKLRSIEHNGEVIKLQLWDSNKSDYRTKGYVNYRDLRNLDMFVVTVDLTDIESLNEAKNIVQSIIQYSRSYKIPKVVIMGTKNDAEIKAVQDNDLQSLALELQQNDINSPKPIVISSKEGRSNIDAALHQIADSLLNKSAKIKAKSTTKLTSSNDPTKSSEIVNQKSVPNLPEKFIVFDRDDTLIAVEGNEYTLINPSAIIPLMKAISDSTNMKWAMTSFGSSPDINQDDAIIAIRKHYPIAADKNNNMQFSSTTMFNDATSIQFGDGTSIQRAKAQDLLIPGILTSLLGVRSLPHTYTDQNSKLTYTITENTTWKIQLPNQTIITFDAGNYIKNSNLWDNGKGKLYGILMALDAAKHAPQLNEELKKIGITNIEAPTEFKRISMDDIIFVDDLASNCKLVRAAGCKAINADTDAAKEEKLEDTGVRNTYLRKIYNELPENTKQLWVKNKFGNNKLYSKLKEFRQAIDSLNQFSSENPALSEIIKNLNLLHDGVLNEALLSNEKNINNTAYLIILNEFTELTKKQCRTPKTPISVDELEKFNANLNKKLCVNPPSIPIKAIVCGVICAFVGFALGAFIGALATFYLGGSGGIVTGVLGAIKGFGIGVAIASGSGALIAGGSAFTASTLFNRSKNKKIAESVTNLSDQIQGTKNAFGKKPSS